LNKKSKEKKKSFVYLKREKPDRGEGDRKGNLQSKREGKGTVSHRSGNFCTKQHTNSMLRAEKKIRRRASVCRRSEGIKSKEGETRGRARRGVTVHKGPQQPKNGVAKAPKKSLSSHGGQDGREVDKGLYFGGRAALALRLEICWRGREKADLEA